MAVENQSFNIVKHIENRIIIDINNVVLKIFIGLLILNNNINPVNTVKIIHMLEYVSIGRLYFMLINTIKIIFITVVKAIGIDFAITFGKNFPLTLSVFGSNAKINDGIPIHTNDIKLNCIGINGYGIFANTKIIASIVA